MTSLFQAMFDDDYYEDEDDDDALQLLGLSKDDEGMDEAAAAEDLDAILQSKGKQRPKDRGRAAELEQKFIEKELAEVDAADFEDVIGDLPTRFKYREVPAISIKSKAQPLTPLQILTIDDDELNKMEPLKIIAAPYRCVDACNLRACCLLTHAVSRPFCFVESGPENSRCGRNTTQRVDRLERAARATTNTRAGAFGAPAVLCWLRVRVVATRFPAQI